MYATAYLAPQFPCVAAGAGRRRPDGLSASEPTCFRAEHSAPTVSSRCDLNRPACGFGFSERAFDLLLGVALAHDARLRALLRRVNTAALAGSAPGFDLFERFGEDVDGVVELGFGGCGGGDEAED